MQVTPGHVKEYLGSAKEYQCVAASCYNRLEEIKSAATNITSKITGMPNGGGSDSSEKLTRFVFDKDQADAEWRKWSDAAYRRRQRILYFIRDMPIEDIEKAILIRRYCNDYLWDEITDGLPYSRSKVYRIHQEAIEQIADYINSTGKYYEEIMG